MIVDSEDMEQVLEAALAALDLTPGQRARARKAAWVEWQSLRRPLGDRGPTRSRGPRAEDQVDDADSGAADDSPWARQYRELPPEVRSRRIDLAVQRERAGLGNASALVRDRFDQRVWGRRR